MVEAARRNGVMLLETGSYALNVIRLAMGAAPVSVTADAS